MSGMKTRRPLRIAQMLESGGPGGAEMVLINLSVELRERGHHILPVGPAKGGDWLTRQLTDLDFEPGFFTLERPLDPGCLRGMIQLLRDERIDVVHSHEFTMCIYGAAAAAWLRRPHVTTMHGSQTMTGALRRRLALRAAYRGCDSVVAVSGATQASLVDDLGLPAEAFEVVRNGVPIPQGRREGVRKEFGARDDEVLLLALGTIVPRKGHMYLLKALADLEARGDCPPWRLVIAGMRYEEEPERLERFAEEAGFADRVFLPGQRQDVHDLLAAADVFVMPSLWEGLPLAILEAMLAEKPIVATACSGIPEAIVEGREGLLVPPGEVEPLADTLGRVLADAGLRERLARTARDRALEEFTIAAMADRYEALYDRALRD